MTYQSSSVLSEGTKFGGAGYLNSRNTVSAFSSAPQSIESSVEIQDTTTAGAVLRTSLDALVVGARIVGRVARDSSVYAGRLLSDEVLEREKLRGLIFTSIKRFAEESDDCLRITSETALASQGMINSLGSTFMLPKIAPDNEGGLLAVWEGSNSSIAVVIDGWKLHLVANAGTPQAEYFDDLPFDGKNLPNEILRVVPRT